MNYKQITKAEARKLYYQDKEIFLYTSKMSWHNPWIKPCPVKIDREDEKSRMELHERWPNDPFTKEPKKFITQFELDVNEYHYYNCCKERGMRVIFLIEDK